MDNKMKIVATISLVFAGAYFTMYNGSFIDILVIGLAHGLAMGAMWIKFEGIK